MSPWAQMLSRSQLLLINGLRCDTRPRRVSQWKIGGSQAAPVVAMVQAAHIRRIHGEKPLEMALVQGDDMVEQIASAAADPAFGHPLFARAFGSRFAPP